MKNKLKPLKSCMFLQGISSIRIRSPGHTVSFMLILQVLAFNESLRKSSSVFFCSYTVNVKLLGPLSPTVDPTTCF